MSPDVKLDVWAKLAEPFPDDEVKQRPGAATWDHKQACEGNRCRDTRDAAKHIQFSYVDARAVAQRLDEVMTPGGWDFTCNVIPGTDVVKGTLTVGGSIREDHGYPNSERDEEPIKAATSDALKRCAVLFGIGRHLYDDNKPGHRPRPAAVRQPVQPPPRSSTAVREPEFPDDFGQDEWSPPANVTPMRPPVRDEFPVIGGLQPNVGEECPKHPGESWKGAPLDLYHRNPSGGYCRPDGQPKKARA